MTGIWKSFDRGQEEKENGVMKKTIMFSQKEFRSKTFLSGMKKRSFLKE